MKKIITIVLLSLSCFYCSAQELQTTKKENIYTVIPNVENLFVLMNCTLDQFESTMKKALLQQSEGGICVTGTAEELWLHIGTENPWTLILLMLKLIGSHILLVIRITRA